MPDQSHPPLQFNGARTAGMPVDASARWLADEGDVALGCECADPALQIERWAQEACLPQSPA